MLLRVRCFTCFSNHLTLNLGSNSRQDLRRTALPSPARQHSDFQRVHVRIPFFSQILPNDLIVDGKSYNEALATVRRVPNVEHNFLLVITRVYEEGGQELLEDEDESEWLVVFYSTMHRLLNFEIADEEREFLIDQELEFRTDKTPEGDPTLVWRDLAGDVDEFFEFVATGTNEPTKAFFETCMYRAMYERKYNRSADNAGEEDLQEFIYKSVLFLRWKRLI